jgi:hypothetical protein
MCGHIVTWLLVSRSETVNKNNYLIYRKTPSRNNELFLEEILEVARRLVESQNM